MIVSFFSHCYTSPPDFHFPLLEILSLAIGDRDQLKSLHTLASSQTACPYKVLLPCLFFHCFSYCCVLSSHPVVTVLSLPCKVSTLLLKQPSVIMFFVSTVDFIGVLRIPSIFLGAPNSCTTVIQEHLMVTKKSLNTSFWCPHSKEFLPNV